MTRARVIAAIGAALLALSVIRAPLPVAGPVPALWLVLCCELAFLAVIACSLGWRVTVEWR